MAHLPGCEHVAQAEREGTAIKVAVLPSYCKGLCKACNAGLKGAGARKVRWLGVLVLRLVVVCHAPQEL